MPAVERRPLAAGEEVDLSDEWEAMAQEVADPAVAAQATPAEPFRADEGQERIKIKAEDEPTEILEDAAEIAEIADPASEPSFEITDESTAEIPVAEIMEAGEAAMELPAPPAAGEFELELTPQPAPGQTRNSAETTEDFLNELAAEIEGMESPAADVPAETAAPVAAATSTLTPEASSDSLNELSEVFQEFRNELGELGEEDEDLETHYNLGIAYREMGLLDEAIGEFQKVAKAVQMGKPFRYSMNCATMLALSFMDKGEPKIASLWYERALEVPGLDPEAILALRYDLAVALDMAGNEAAALDIFRQVYAINIDFRDVADRIAILQKH